MERNDANPDASRTAVTVLLIEDEENDAMLFRRIVTRARPDVDVLLTQDGNDALAIIDTDQPLDLVIVDGKMPRMGGAEFLSRIGKTVRTPKIPVVVFTGSDMPKTSDEWTALGAREVVTKPVDLDQYRLAVIGILDRWVC